MSDNVTQWIAAGFERMEYSLLSTTGVITGGTLTSLPANGSGVSIARFTGVQSAEPTIPEPEFVAIPGDDDVQGKFTFAPADTPSFNILHGVNDLTIGAASESTTNVAYGDVTVRSLQPGAPVYRDALLLFIRQAKEKGAGDGLQGYEHLCIYKSQLVTASIPQAFNGREGGQYRTSVNTTRSSKRPWGESLSDGTHGTTSEVCFTWFDNYRWTFFLFQGDNSATDIVLSKTPVNDTGRCLVRRFDTGAALTVSSITTATKTVVLSAAPAAALSCVVWHAYTE
jgi:hypothetical protein